MNLKRNFFDLARNDDDNRISHEEAGAYKKVAEKLAQLLPSGIQPIVFVCIGTDRSTGDSLGPLIGSKLSEKGTSYFHVYGTLDEPIHAVNLQEKLDYIHQTYRNPFIIGIDACLGRVKSVGHISVGEGPVKPGAGVNKDLPPVGNAHITGIVNVSGFMEFFVLQNTRLSLVMKMADAIADGIAEAERLRLTQTVARFNWRESQLQTP